MLSSVFGASVLLGNRISCSQAMDVTIHLPDLPTSMPSLPSIEAPRLLPMPSLPSMPEVPTLPTLDEVVDAVPIPEMFKSVSQQAVDSLSIYRQPISQLRRELSRMKEGSIEFEEKGMVIRIAQTYFSPTQRPSLLATMDRLAPVIGSNGEGLQLATSMREEAAVLTSGARAEDLTTQKTAAKAMAGLLEEAFDLLGGVVPPPSPIGNGKLLGII